MHVLGLDLGTRRTGVAFGDTTSGILAALRTIEHTSIEELIASLSVIMKEKKIEKICIGLPMLPGGSKGSQAKSVEQDAGKIQAALKIPIEFIDERYTSTGAGKKVKDAKAACEILSVAMDRISE